MDADPRPTATASPTPRQTLVCTCEGTMPIDAKAIGRGCGTDVASPAHQLCRAELDRFRAALGTGAPLTIGCTQEAPLFAEVAADAGFDAALDFANIRETAGWSTEATAAGPKMAALLAAASEPMPPIALATLTSQGVVLVLGRDQAALDAATRLADHLDVTLLLLPGSDVAPPRRTKFPVFQGRASKAAGMLGRFEVTVDAYALADPASRARLRFGPARDGAVSTCDLILDLTGVAPLFPASDLRPGYLRADPRAAAQVERAVFDAVQLVGTFDKPRFVDFSADLCAHSRSGITGCTNCLDLCPTGAITPAGDHVAIDPGICAGCGQCASACPTGAASYALPPVAAFASRLRVCLRAYAAAGGTGAVLLLHDDGHGADLVEAAGRFTDGLPARVLPLAVNEISQVGPETIATALAYGAASVRLLTRARPPHGTEGLAATHALMTPILAALGYGAGAFGIVATDDPDALVAELRAVPPGPARASVASFLPPADKRTLLTRALTELYRTAPVLEDRISLPPGAPFGAVVLDTQACTLCHACVGACPVQALGDDPAQPLLSFAEDRCVQCGLCAATCPEDAITLAPQIDFAAWETGTRVLKSEEPFACTSCGKPFGTASAIARVRDRLASHWMYSGPEGAARARVLEMCEDCRVEALVTESFDPHETRARNIRTTADYLRERAARTDPDA